MADPVQTATPINILQEVLGFLQTACGVVASASAIEMLIAALPVGTQAVAIANMVCQAVMALGMKAKPGDAPTTVTVKGVKLTLHKSPV